MSDSLPIVLYTRPGKGIEHFLKEKTKENVS